MYKRSFVQNNTRKPPLINMSSDQESLSQDESSNAENRQPLHNRPNNHSNKTAQSIYSNQAHKNSEAQSHTYKQTCNFSTLSLDEGSLLDYDSLIKSLTNQNKILSRQNENIQNTNKELNGQIQILGIKMKQLSVVYDDNNQKLQNALMQIENLRQKNKYLQEQLKKVEKKCQNLTINQQLPNKKQQQNQQQLKNIQNLVYDKIKQICNTFLNELSKQKMSVKVQNIITDFINSIIAINQKTQKNVFHQYNSFHSAKNPQNYPTRAHFPMTSHQTTKNNISNDYRLLQKSIEKLKEMEKQIDEKNGSYLKRQHISDSNLSKSVVLDTSICILDRSKSKRKRIFQ